MSAEQSRLLAADAADDPSVAENSPGQPNIAGKLAPGPLAEGRPSTSPSLGSDYVVVARRYRPQSFDELVGQEHVAKALSNAIATNRVGHAYLFTGARGVGKTSAARILAKALDCVRGPTATPCNECDICLNVAVGSDVDVLEIDGASNRGIDEIRQLRQNVGVRPSRALFKIYIIDEVHMLTPQAFNALLKTLEEPPEHVKFIFCTTEANKIPITILSRCQRFDFAGIRAPSIRERLAQIAQAEGVAAEPAALELLARRANGSMRDSQSLLEQLLSFGGDVIRAADIHALLGTAGDDRISQLLAHLAQRDARGALAELDTAVREGVEVGQLLEQLMAVLRDAMTAALGCDPAAFLYTSVENQDSVAAAGRSLGLTNILAILQILDQSLARMRFSTQSRILAETALVRIASLANLESIGELFEHLHGNDEPARSVASSPRAGGSAGNPRSPAPPQAALATQPDTAIDPAKKKAELTAESPEVSLNEAAPSAEANLPGEANSPQADHGPLPEAADAMAPESVEAAPADVPASQETPSPQLDPELVWRDALQRLPEGMLIAHAQHGQRIATIAPNRMAICFPRRYNFSKSFCEQPDRLAELRAAVTEAAGRAMQIEFVLEADAPVARVDEPAAPQIAVGSRQWVAERTAKPIVGALVEAFGAAVTRVDPPAG